MISTWQDSPEFYYGRRQIVTYNHTGQPQYQYEALTTADFLNPQNGDAFNHGDRHDTDVLRVVGIFRHLYRNNPVRTVFTGLKMQWARKGLSCPAPDVAIVSNVLDPEKPRQVFDIASEGASPEFILEVVSPRFAAQDLSSKLHVYAGAGVPEYFIIDSGERESNDSMQYQILGYCLRNGTFQRIEPDGMGRVLSEVNNVWLSISTCGAGFQVISSRTGKPIEPTVEVMESATHLRSQGEARARLIAESLNLDP